MKVSIINKAISKKRQKHLKRKIRVRSKISGTASVPRMSFFRSNKNISVQIIDDRKKETLLSISTYEAEFASLKPTVETAKKLGSACGARLKEKNIEQVVFDRNGYKYHGVLQAFVEQTREEGIKI